MMLCFPGLSNKLEHKQIYDILSYENIFFQSLSNWISIWLEHEKHNFVTGEKSSLPPFVAESINGALQLHSLTMILVSQSRQQRNQV